MQKTCLIIPCYNEEKRLKLAQFKAVEDSISFVFVNDGSRDGTVDLISKNLPKNSFLYDLKQNQGKAEAVRLGMLYALKKPELRECQWIGFWDADLATPLFEVENMFKYIQTFNLQADGIFGSRIKRAGSEIQRKVLRHYLGRIFATISSTYLQLPTYDSQCGAKLFLRDTIEELFTEKFVSKWIFDVEIIVRMKNLKIVEYPLQKWIDIAGSKVRVSRESFRVLKDLYNIKHNIRNSLDRMNN